MRNPHAEVRVNMRKRHQNIRISPGSIMTAERRATVATTQIVRTKAGNAFGQSGQKAYAASAKLAWDGRCQALLCLRIPMTK
jgi:hypothetical protein